MRFRRTNTILITIAILFIIAIIILICIPRNNVESSAGDSPLRSNDTRTTGTTHTTTSTTRSTTTTEPQSTTRSTTSTEPPSTTTTITTTTETPKTTTQRMKTTTDYPRRTTTTHSYTSEESTDGFDGRDMYENSTFEDDTTSENVTKLTTLPFDEETDGYDEAIVTTTIRKTSSTSYPTTTTDNPTREIIFWYDTSTEPTSTPLQITTTEALTTTTTTTETSKTETPATTTETFTTQTPTTTTSTTEAITTHPPATTTEFEYSSALPTTTTTTETTTTMLTTQSTTTTPKPPTTSYCSTVECRALASNMLSKIDHTISPCQNFYQYSCGAVDQHITLPVPLQNLRKMYFEEELQKQDNDSVIKIFFESCLFHRNSTDFTESMKTVKNFMAELTPSFKEEEDLTGILRKFFESDYDPFFRIVFGGENLTDWVKISPASRVSKILEFPDEKLCVKDTLLQIQTGHSNHIQRVFDNCMAQQGLDAKLAAIKRSMKELDEIYTPEKYDMLYQILKDTTYGRNADNEIIEIDIKSSSKGHNKYSKTVNFIKQFMGRHLEGIQKIYLANPTSIGTIIDKLQLIWNEDKNNVRTALTMLYQNYLYNILVSSNDGDPYEYCWNAVQEFLPIPLTQMLLSVTPEKSDIVNKMKSDIKPILEGNFDDVVITDDYASNIINILKSGPRIRYWQIQQLMTDEAEYLSKYLPLENYLTSVQNEDALPNYVKLATLTKKQRELIFEENVIYENNKDVYMHDDGTNKISIRVNEAQLKQKFYTEQSSLKSVLKEYITWKNKNPINDSLIWLKPETQSGLRVMYLLAAQEHCESNDIHLEKYLEGKIPSEPWVNGIIQNDKIFQETFNCSDGTGHTDSEDFPIPLQKLGFSNRPPS